MQRLGLETQTCSRGSKQDSFPLSILHHTEVDPVLVVMGLTADPHPSERGFFKQFIDVHVGRLLSQGQCQISLFLGQLGQQQTFSRADALDRPERFLLAEQSETLWV